jgi:uncharacterized protein YjiS (DUF1127 family)
MTAQTPRQSLHFEQPAMLSYHATWDDADYEPQVPAPRWSAPAHLLFFAATRLAAFVGARVQAARARRMAASEMVTMSDREFADMGITRCDASRVLDPAFVPDRQRAGV